MKRHSSGHRIGLITIGQSPRPDLLHALELSGRDDVAVLGALDSATEDDVLQMRWSPDNDELPLFTWYCGRPFILGKRRLSTYVQKAVSTIESRVSAVSILCTESFGEVKTSVTNIQIDRLLFNETASLINGRASRLLGVFVPVQGQVVPGEARWGLFANAQAICLRPKSEDYDIRGACQKLIERCGSIPDLVVLDCMGYGDMEARVVSEEMGCPTVLPVELLKAVLYRYLKVGV
ncbi:MAG: AroM family protein [Bacilli bacterium]